MAKKIDIGGELHSVATDHKVADASEIKDVSKGNKSQAAFNNDVNRHEVEIHGTGGIDSRLDDLEAMEQIVIDGGDAQIATGSDFTNPDATKRAKVPTVGAIVDGLNDGVYDVSKRNPTGGENGDGKFTLAYILTNADTLIPTSWKHGGMTISFVDSSDNNYIQARCTAQNFTTDTTQWAICDDDILVDNPEWLYILADRNSRIMGGWKINGDFEFLKGVPTPIKKFITEYVIKAITEYDSLNYENNPEYTGLVVDKNRRIFEAFKKNGNKLVLSPVENKSIISYDTDDPSWFEYITDVLDRIIIGIKRNGSFFVHKLVSNNISITSKLDYDFHKTSWLYEKTWVALGDSITAFGQYTSRLSSMYNMNLVNVAIGGAKWQNYSENSSKVDFRDLVIPEDVHNPSNVMMNQVYRLLRKATPTTEIVPEIDENTVFAEGWSYPVYGLGELNREDINLITLACGVNDRWSSGELGNILDFSSVAYQDCDKRILVGAMKWACIVLNKYFPKANIVILAPMQVGLGDGSDAADQKLYNIVMTQVDFGAYYGFPVMNMRELVPINRYTDTKETSHRYSNDGLHPNEEGGKVMANCIASYLESIMHYSYR